MDLKNFKAIVFDLDDTIYSEIEYLKKAYKYISHKVFENEKRINLSVNDIYYFLIKTFINDGRHNIYQKMCSRFNILKFSIEDFLNCLRTVPLEYNELPIYAPIHEIITINHTKKLLFIMTNGNEKQQENKIKALNIPYKNKIRVIFSSSLGSKFEKPNSFFLDKILSENNLVSSDVIFFGDSEIDKEAASNSKVVFFDIHNFKNKIIQ